jgi:hypothetical protein
VSGALLRVGVPDRISGSEVRGVGVAGEITLARDRATTVRG